MNKRFKENFIKETEYIRKEMNNGKRIRFNSIEDMDAYIQNNK